MAKEFVDKILSGEIKHRSRTEELKLVGAYLEPDVLEALEKLSKQGGRGAKTAIFNEALRKLFKEKGLL